MLKNNMHSRVAHLALSAICFMLVLSLAGCEDGSEPLLPVPKVIFPETNPIFYPNQRVQIKYEALEDAEMVEVQLLETTDSLLAFKGEQAFSIAGISGTSPQGSTGHIYDPSAVEEKLYCGFRVRQRIGKEASAWTKIYYFRVHPLSTLQVKRISVVADFDFVTQQSGSYYSGITRSLNKINIDSLMIAKGVTPNRIRLLKPVSRYIDNNGSNYRDLQRISIGFTETGQGEFPFDVLGETNGGAQRAELKYYPNGGLYRNLYEDLGGKSKNMILAYFLAFNKSAGGQHHLAVNLTMDCYFK